MTRRLLAIPLALALVAVAGAPAGATVAHPDLSYDLDSPAADPNLNALDLYLPDDAQPSDSRPVVVYVHGGGWRAGDKANQIARKVNLFTGAGYVFASVNYRLSPDDVTALAPDRIKFPDHPHDVGEAIGWLARNVGAYGGDPTRLLLIGHSAGAHLVDLVSTDPSYVEAYGVEPWRLIGTVSLDTDATDVTSRIAEGGPQTKALFYNAFGSPAENAASGSWAAASPLAFADPGDPRLLAVTQAAVAGRVADNQAFVAALGEAPDSVLAVPYDHGGINDAVGDPADGAGETAAIMSFFAQRVAASADPAAKLAKKPGKRVRSTRRRPRVRFELAPKGTAEGIECRLDSHRLKPCKRRPSYRVGAGRHTFRYRALGDRGRPGKTKAYRFRVSMAG